MRPFLTAEWRHIILLTYEVDAELLEPYLPKGMVLDTYKGRTFVSVVAFDFLKTKIKGIPIPFHYNFPEINLRFYVKYGERRGVVFIKEIVPKPLISLVARKLYNEPYETAKLTSDNWREEENKIGIEFALHYKKNDFYWKFIMVDEPYLPAADSTEHFFKEQEWGFGVGAKGDVIEYRVEHPEWRIYPLEDRFELEVDFGTLYGEQWSFLNHQIPYNIMVAEGSPIKVFPARKLNIQ